MITLTDSEMAFLRPLPNGGKANLTRSLELDELMQRLSRSASEPDIIRKVPPNPFSDRLARPSTMPGWPEHKRMPSIVRSTRWNGTASI